MTGQTDVAHFVMDDIAGAWQVEPKLLKLLRHRFRNHAAVRWHCTLQIARRLVDLLSPVWLRIGACWYPRGGIAIDVFWQIAVPPAGVWIPDQGLPPYRGRG